MALDRSLQQYRNGFLFVDSAAIVLAFLLAHSMRHGSLLHIPPAYVMALPWVLIVFLFAFRSFGLYQHRAGGMIEAFRLLAGVAAGMAGVLALSFFYRGFSYSRLTALYFAVLSVILTLHGRYLYRSILDLVFGRSQWLKQVLVVGDTVAGRRIIRELLHEKSDYVPRGVIAPGHSAGELKVDGRSIPVHGGVDQIEAILDRTRPDLVVIADPDLPGELENRIISACIDRNIHWKVLPKLATRLDQDVSLTVVAGLPLLGSKGNNITGFNYVTKRAVDIVASVGLLLLLSPLMLAVAALIKILSPGPVLFVQERIGYRGRPFRFYKFRSMHVSNDDSIHRAYVKHWINGDDAARQRDGREVVHKITKDPRVIPFIGSLIRKFSIDELPQLLNVVKGEMSLVGPRPCLPYEVELYRRWHKMRFDVLPGITGLWQVSGRNRLTFDEMVALDVRYLQNWSLALDAAIMAKTPYVVLFDKAY